MTNRIALSQADAGPPLATDEGDHLAGASPSSTQKSLRVRLIEYFLVLFAVFESGTFHLAYRLTQGPLRVGHLSGLSDWIHYFLRNACALGILGYVLFRNSRWCMAHSPGIESEPSFPPESRTSERASDRVRICEMFLVLIVAFAGTILYSFQVFFGSETLPDVATISLARYGYILLGNAGPLGLLAYVLSRTSRGFRDLGLRWTSRDVAVALPLALGAGLAELLFSLIFAGAQIGSGQEPQGPDIGKLMFGISISILAIPDQVVNGFFEELLVRGYLMTEVRRFTGSILFAILCSVAVQVSYHFYQGGQAALAHIGCFMVFAAYYAKTNRLLPPILAHIAYDLYCLVMYGINRS